MDDSVIELPNEVLCQTTEATIALLHDLTFIKG